MADRTYNPASIEPRWQAYWDEIKLFCADPDPSRPEYYILTMFPYPSGTLHMGHVINYTIGDVMVRYHIMQGKNVLSPMGWDSFGLPAENAAIKAGVHPADHTRSNIDLMRRQMKRAGWGYDWRREIATSHPAYYKWTQWLFLQLYKRGLACKKRAPVNWCPNCRTVLANEQVLNGECERCSTQVEQRDLEQWFFTMSQFAQRLLDNHERLKGWPARVLKMQKEWIGRSEGARIDFEITETGEALPAFTTRVDTLYGVTFMCLAPEHPLIEKLVRGTPQENEVMEAVREMRRQGTAERERLDMEKRGVFTGFHVINPVNDEQVPLWVANFALMTYGTGAVMAVPAHDQRDFEFARKYGLPIRVVIQPPDENLEPATMTAAYEHDGVQVNSGPFDGLPNREAIEKISQFLAAKGKGGAAVNYRLRDWLLSRQRYWGAPIPIIYCDKCGAVPVPEDQLPVLLPRDVEFRPTGESPLAACEEFLHTECPACRGPARRETDTMDTFVDSSWYLFRYVSPRLENAVFDKSEVDYWLPVDLYIGGIEHAAMHLTYFRFFAMALHDLGLLPFEEPAKGLFCQGMICAVAHHCEQCKWLAREDVENARCKHCGGPVQSEMAKMSKTKLNTVSPDELIQEHGADTLRLYILSDAPPDRDQIWSMEGLFGASRFLQRLWNMVQEHAAAMAGSPAVSSLDGASTEESRSVIRRAHRTVQRVTDDIESEMHFNTAIAAVMELMNEVRGAGDLAPGVRRFAFETALRLLAPFVPHIAEELWQVLGNAPSIFRQGWPKPEPAALKLDEIEMPVQVNGRLRGHIRVRVDADQAELERLALVEERVAAHLRDKTVRKVIIVPGRLINVVTD